MSGRRGVRQLVSKGQLFFANSINKKEAEGAKKMARQTHVRWERDVGGGGEA